MTAFISIARDLRDRRTILIPFVSAALFYSFFSSLNVVWTAWMYGKRSGFLSSYQLSDFLLFLLLSVGLYAWSRRNGLFLIVQGSAIGAMFFLHQVNIALLAAPIVPDDLLNLSELEHVLSGWPFTAAAAICLGLVLVAALLVFNLRRPSPAGAAFSVGLLALLWGAAYGAPSHLARRVVGSSWYKSYLPTNNLRVLGPGLYMLVETARYFDDSRALQQGLDGVRAAVTDVQARKPSRKEDRPAAIFKKRNVYIIVMEAFWDVSRLKNVSVSEDPLAASGFRELWNAGGPSWSISPVFGGDGANAEFEILCGQPADLYGPGIVFQSYLRNAAPCLPRILGTLGYRSMAFVPSPRNLFNADRAYRRIGFTDHHALEDFKTADLDGENLADSSLFQQVADAITAVRSRDASPMLVYVFTTAGHYPFEMNLGRRPRRVFVPQSPFIEAYANATSYSAEAMMGFVADLRRNDPNALVLVTGDHLPDLGGSKDQALDTDSQLLLPGAEAAARYKTPLLIIDGARAVAVGVRAMYRLPRLLLNLLGYSDPTCLDLFDHPFPYEVIPRSAIEVWPDGTERKCEDRTASGTRGCEDTIKWVSDARIIGADLIGGSGFTYTVAPGCRLQ